MRLQAGAYSSPLYFNNGATLPAIHYTFAFHPLNIIHPKSCGNKRMEEEEDILTYVFQIITI